MAKLKDMDGYHTYGWMVNQLGLEGGDLTAFALVYGFVKDFAGKFLGGADYLSTWTGWTIKTSRNHLDNLVNSGLLVKEKGRENNLPFCHYLLAPDFYEKYTVKTTVTEGKNYPQETEKTSVMGGKKLPPRIEYIEEKKETNIPPTPQEVTKYASERGFRDPAGFAATFVAYYEAAHWCKKDGTKIRNWRQAVITWEANNKNRVFPKDSAAERKQIGWEQYEKIMQN